MNVKKSRVSVCVITYNHSKYIERALNSILMQVTNFPYEIIIADDCSNDGTADILIEFKKNNPDLISLIRRERNIGAANNWISLLRSAKGEYIAYIEGDDYWTDENKLQKQFDLLESNPMYSLCFHDVEISIGANEARKLRFPSIDKNIFNTVDVIMKPWFCPSSSVFFRTEIINNLPENYADFPNGDVLLLFVASECGLLVRINKCMGVYNYMSENSMSSKQEGRMGVAKKLDNFSKTLRGLKSISKKNIFIYVKIRALRIFLQRIKNRILWIKETLQKSAG